MPTDTSERVLERLICTTLAGHPCDSPPGPTVGEPPTRYGECALSNGAVFSVGSITYTASILVDETVSRITTNVIESFGAA